MLLISNAGAIIYVGSLETAEIVNCVLACWFQLSIPGDRRNTKLTELRAQFAVFLLKSEFMSLNLLSLLAVALANLLA